MNKRLKVSTVEININDRAVFNLTKIKYTEQLDDKLAEVFGHKPFYIKYPNDEIHSLYIDTDQMCSITYLTVNDLIILDPKDAWDDQDYSEIFFKNDKFYK